MVTRHPCYLSLVSAYAGIVRYCFVCDHPVGGTSCPDCGRPAYETSDPVRRLKRPSVPRSAVAIAVGLALVILLLAFQVRWGIR